MATNNIEIMAKILSIKSGSIWAYKYDMHLVLHGHIIGITDYLACVVSTQIQCCFALTTRDVKLYPINQASRQSTDLSQTVVFGMSLVPSVSVNFISLVTPSVRLREEESQTAFPTSCTWASHLAASMLMGR